MAGVRFAAVSRAADRVLVASYTHKLHNSSKADPFLAVVTRVLGSPQTVEDYPRLTITDREVGTIHYDSSRTCIFLVVTAPDYPQRIAFKCLADLKSRFESSFGEQLHKSAEGGLSKVARQLMTDVCTTFADPASVDKAIGVQRQVDDVKGIMSDSISEMLATRENLEVLEDKTENLRSEAAGFQRKAGALKRALWWRNMKIKIVCGQPAAPVTWVGKQSACRAERAPTDRPPAAGLLITIVLAYILVPVLVSAYGTAETVLVTEERR